MEEDAISNASQWFQDNSSLINSTTTLLKTTTPSSTLTTAAELEEDILPPPSELLRYFQLSSLSLVAVVGFLSNVLVLLLFYKRPTLRSFSNRFVLNLSISHFWQSILVMPTTVISIATDKWLLGDTFCIISGFIFTTLNITSVLSLLLIALDRNLAVNSPLHYSMTITKNRTGFLIFTTWFIGLLVASPPLFKVTQIDYRQNWHMCTIMWQKNDTYSLVYGSILIVVGFLVPFLTTICVYSSMCQAAKDNSERARKHSVNSTIVETNIPDSQVKMGSITAKKKCRRWSSGSNQFFGEEWKAVRTGFLVVMTFTVCWLPYFVVTSVETYYNSETTMPSYLMFMVVLCIFSACAINPYLYVFRNKTSRKNIKQLICSSNLTKNKKWMFQRQNKDKANQTSANPCILAVSLVNESSEKVKALPALYQDIDGRWQTYSTSEERSREDLDETISNVSDEDFFDTGFQRVIAPTHKRKHTQTTNAIVQAIYNNTFSRNTLAKHASSVLPPNSSSRLLLCRLKTSLNTDSTSSDTTENCSMSLESNISNENHVESDATASCRRGIGKYLFNTSEELWESKPTVTYHKRIGSVPEEPTLLNTNRKTFSSFGKARRKSFIHSHMKNKKSSETTLTSSTNSETLESSSAASTSKSSSNRPKLVRQIDTVEPPDEYITT